MSKKCEMPKFQLQNVYADGSRDEPELHALNGIDAACRMGRRGFLLTSAIGAGVLAALTLGCDSPPEKKASPEKAPALPQVTAQSMDGVAAHWPASLYTLAFSPDNSLLVSGSLEKKAKLWSVPDGKLLRVLTNDYSIPFQAVFSPDNGTLVLNSGTLSFWKPPYTDPFRRLGGVLFGGLSSTISPDGKLLAVEKNNHREMLIGKEGFGPEENLLLLFSLPDGEEVLRLKLEREIQNLLFSPDSAMLAFGYRGTSTDFELLAIPSGKPIIKGGGNGALMAFSSDGALLALRSNDQLTFLPIPSGEPRPAPQIKPGSFAAVAFSPDGKWLAVGSDNCDVALLPPPFDKPVLALKGHTSVVKELAFSLDGRYLASGSDDGVIYIWELQEKAPGARFHAALFDPDSTWSGTKFAHATLSGQGVYIGACGSSLPAGAVCTCNCVSGTVRDKPQRPSGGGGWSGGGGGGCQCNTICTCVPVK